MSRFRRYHGQPGYEAQGPPITWRDLPPVPAGPAQGARAEPVANDAERRAAQIACEALMAAQRTRVPDQPPCDAQRAVESQIRALRRVPLAELPVEGDPGVFSRYPSQGVDGE
jgi:hypothetical protein